MYILLKILYLKLFLSLSMFNKTQVQKYLYCYELIPYINWCIETKCQYPNFNFGVHG